MPVAEALTLLSFTPRHGAREVAKVIKSAVANAEHNYNLETSDLRVDRIEIDQAADHQALHRQASRHGGEHLQADEPPPLLRHRRGAEPERRRRSVVAMPGRAASTSARPAATRRRRPAQVRRAQEAAAAAVEAEAPAEEAESVEGESTALADATGETELADEEPEDDEEPDDGEESEDGDDGDERGGQLMGQKVNPIGFRLGIYRQWDSRWYADRDYTKLLHEDLAMRKLIGSRLRNAGVARIETERSANQLTVIIQTAKPGIVIGKQGASVDALRDELERISGKKVRVTIHEIKTPELDAKLVAENVASQLEKRIAFRRALKQTVMRSMRAGAKGVKLEVSGRLGGAEMSRREWDRDGRVPLHTLRANIDYGQAEARTTFGRIGVTCWIYKGDYVTATGEPVMSGGPGRETSDSLELVRAAVPERAARPVAARAPSPVETAPAARPLAPAAPVDAEPLAEAEEILDAVDVVVEAEVEGASARGLRA